jgi:outer membrane protein assembly factor BamB
VTYQSGRFESRTRTDVHEKTVRTDVPDAHEHLTVLFVLAVFLIVLVAGPAVGHFVGMSYRPPAVADGELYVTSTDGHLYALDSDGSPRWAVNASAMIVTPATVAGDSVLLGTDTGRVLAVERSDGTIRWDQQLTEDGIDSIAVGSDYSYVEARSQISAVTDNGSVAWRFSPDRAVVAPVATGEHGAYVVESNFSARNGTLYALARNGTVRWTRETHSIVEQVTVSNGTVYHAEDERVVATAANGTELWTVALGGVEGPPSVQDGTVVVGTENGTIAAIEKGTVTWRYRASDATSPTAVSPRLVGDTVYATTWRGLVAVENGVEQWRRTLGATVHRPPTVGDHIYVGTQINRTYAVTREGSFAWIDRYSTTTADVPWYNIEPVGTFWNPQGSVTRVIGPDGRVVPQEHRDSRPWPVLAAGVLALSALVIASRYWR